MKPRMTPEERNARRKLAALLKDPARREIVRAATLQDAARTDEHDTSPTTPTPEEIAERCAEIQSTWTVAERKRRIVDETQAGDIAELPVLRTGVRRRGGYAAN